MCKILIIQVIQLIFDFFSCIYVYKIVDNKLQSKDVNISCNDCDNEYLLFFI